MARAKRSNSHSPPPRPMSPSSSFPEAYVPRRYPIDPSLYTLLHPNGLSNRAARPLPEDFVLQAFQTPASMDKLVQALDQRDQAEERQRKEDAFRAGMRSIRVQSGGHLLLPGFRNPEKDTEMDLLHFASTHSRQGTNDSTATVRPRIPQAADGNGSASDTEKDEPSSEDKVDVGASAVKKTKKKKNNKKKKKKSKGVTAADVLAEQEKEVVEDVGAEEGLLSQLQDSIEAEEKVLVDVEQAVMQDIVNALDLELTIDLGATGRPSLALATRPPASFELEFTGETGMTPSCPLIVVTPESPVVALPLDPMDLYVDESRPLAELEPLDVGLGEASTDCPSTIATPKTPVMPLAVDPAAVRSPCGPDVSAQGQHVPTATGSITPKDQSVEDPQHEVIVRLPGQLSRVECVADDHNDADDNKENVAPPKIANRLVQADIAAMIELPPTPPHSPPSDSASMPTMDTSKASMPTLKQPPTPPDVPVELVDPVNASIQPDVSATSTSLRPMPLARAWTLYHSNTGAAVAKPAPGPGALGIQISSSSRPALRSKAEDFSHGLFPLFTADNVYDLLGSWRALRRKIAHKTGRGIEPEHMPIPPGGEGLGIALLPEDTNFHFFISDVKPMWEDPMCAAGGKIMLSGGSASMDPTFLNLIFLLVGTIFERVCPAPPGFSSLVVGVVLSKRKAHTRIEIWLGGREPLPAVWVNAVEQLVADEFPKLKVYPYRPFFDVKKTANGPGQARPAPPTKGGGLAVGQ